MSANQRSAGEPDPRAPAGAPGTGDATHAASMERYWKRVLRLTLTLLAVWFAVGYLLAIVLAPRLNAVPFLGGPLGFWIAQNGAIYVFWILILVYAVTMNRVDREFDVHDDEA